MKKQIIDLRMDIEELQELPMYRWTELLWQRRREVKAELKRLKEAHEFLQLATAEDLKMRALRYKEVVHKRLKRDKGVRHLMREYNPSIERKTEKRIDLERKENEKI